jgi:hypothetical protein
MCVCVCVCVCVFARTLSCYKYRTTSVRWCIFFFSFVRIVKKASRGRYVGEVWFWRQVRGPIAGVFSRPHNVASRQHFTTLSDRRVVHPCDVGSAFAANRCWRASWRWPRSVVCEVSRRMWRLDSHTEILFAVNAVHIWWILTAVSLVEMHERFRGMCCLHLHGSSPYCLPTHLHEIEFQIIAVFVPVLVSQIPLWQNLTTCGMWLVIKRELKKECAHKLYFVHTVFCVFTILIYKCLQAHIRSVSWLCVIRRSEKNSNK